MRHRIARWSAFVALTLSVACRDQATSVTGVGFNALTGHWSEDSTVVGSSLVLSLSVNDTLVTGTGTYAIEAGRSGTLTVSGGVTAARVSLDFSYDYGAVAHFDGTPPTGTQLAGAIKYGPKDAMIASYLITFHKTP
jgi:hypothetical protein